MCIRDSPRPASVDSGAWRREEAGQGAGRSELKRGPMLQLASALSFLPSRARKQAVSPGYRIVYCSNLIVVMETAEVLPCFAVARIS